MKKFNFKQSTARVQIAKALRIIAQALPYEEWSPIIFFLLHLRKLNLVHKLSFDCFINKESVFYISRHYHTIA